MFMMTKVKSTGRIKLTNTIIKKYLVRRLRSKANDQVFTATTMQMILKSHWIESQS